MSEDSEIKIDLHLAEGRLKKLDFDKLKEELREYEAAQEYEICRLIQNEIDARVK